jgi:hypothetical protein
MNILAIFVMSIFLSLSIAEDKAVEEVAKVEESVTITVTE